MAAVVLDGRALSATLREELAADVAAFKESSGFTPGIAVVLAGADPASERYSQQIGRTFEGIGMAFRLEKLPATVSQSEVLDLIAALNADPGVNGIIVQMPLPRQVSQEAVASALSPAKDVDGITPINAGRLLAGAGDYFAPATPSGGMEILHRHGIELKGKRAVVVGRSNIVGKPMALLMLHEHATVTICHSRTQDLGGVIREGDIVAAAVGKARMITGDMIKPGAIVIDFGVNFVEGKMVGDVDYESAVQVAGAITPVPGGTGPMTNMMLVRNTLESAKKATAAK
ncbi:MAG: bifunctional 5,10-methylenetetrahydrofolate dehydrogenase/5,10-methenyltetrahydrofolate cyclohydrolase [Bacteroidetes bacterium]|nr:bifunctional 5,10-methylenetetrahydrofolate dehydrogenase/5,10-methenyltetrahydrofolate cyclohydrolase [Bacteroidota bacterium]